MRRGILPPKQDWLHIALTLVLIPLFYCYELMYILPQVCKECDITYYIHIANSVFFLQNIVGNLAKGARGGGTVIGRMLPPATPEWKTCEVCECQTPPRSWHCSVCDVCILKRDHHCNFFGCCIGYFNHRYFYMFVFHIFVSTLYAFYFNLLFMIEFVPWSTKTWLSVLRFAFPLAAVVFDASPDSINVLLFLTNIIVTAFTGFLFFYHGRVILRGQVTPETKLKFFGTYNSGWKANLTDVLGKRWYLVWISPFLPSELPGDGMTWKIHGIVKNE